MIEQPTALWLADELDERVVPRWVHATGETPKQSGYAQDRECVQAAAELRRLHAENEALRGIVGDFPPIEAELHDVSDRAHQLSVQRNALLAQRDALLEALKMLVLATKEVSVGNYNEEVHRFADRYNAIRADLDAAGVEYDQIALLFGAELQLDLAGSDDKDVRA